jgi:hypothetical protein
MLRQGAIPKAIEVSNGIEVKSAVYNADTSFEYANTDITQNNTTPRESANLDD